jgi:hypothetical protein
MAERVYEVWTNLDPEKLNDVGREIFQMWFDFALGHQDLGGKHIAHPTGRYASSLQYRRWGRARVSIVANEKIAPEAVWIEEGHAAVNMLEKLTLGRKYPMHRGTEFSYVGANAPKMWASARESGFSGYARVPADGIARGPNTSGRGPAWTVPEMPAYAPAKILADLIRAQYGRAQKAV